MKRNRNIPSRDGRGEIYIPSKHTDRAPFRNTRTSYPDTHIDHVQTGEHDRNTTIGEEAILFNIEPGGRDRPYHFMHCDLSSHDTK